VQTEQRAITYRWLSELDDLGNPPQRPQRRSIHVIAHSNDWPAQLLCCFLALLLDTQHVPFAISSLLLVILLIAIFA